MTARLAVATGTRAEYGIFRPLLREFQARDWPFDLYVTGSHLAPRHGQTVSEIEGDGFDIAERVDIDLAEDTPTGISRSMAIAIGRFGELLDRRRPDLLFLLGDRFETFAIAAAAQDAGVPVAHLHGGEVTEGVIDEAFRHAITKMSRLHFVSTEEHRRRVIQLGEPPATVFNVGALGLDNIRSLEIVPQQALERDLGFTFRDTNLLVTHHPLTLDLHRSEQDFAALLQALAHFPEAGILITAPNADPGGSRIAEMIDAFVAAQADRVKVFTSLGTLRYFSVLRCVDAVIGNSSSGLIEVPSFGVPTVNIGDRQRGRVAGPSVIHSAASPDAITAAIGHALSPECRRAIIGLPNPYGSGNTAAKICDVVGDLAFPIDRRKSFQDLPTSG